MWEEDMLNLETIHPWEYQHITGLYESIHNHYRMGWDISGPDAYCLARELDAQAILPKLRVGSHA